MNTETRITILGIIVAAVVGLLGVLARIPEGQDWLRRTWARISQTPIIGIRFVARLLGRAIKAVKRLIKSREASILFLLVLFTFLSCGIVDSIQDPESMAEAKASAMVLILAVSVAMFMIACILLHQIRVVRDRLESRLDTLYEIPEIGEMLGVYEDRLYANVCENWDPFLAALRKKDFYAANEMGQCAPLMVEGDTLIVGCSNVLTYTKITFPTQREYASVKRAAEQVLGRLFGKPNKVRFQMTADAEIVKVKSKLVKAAAQVISEEAEERDVPT